MATCQKTRYRDNIAAMLALAETGRRGRDERRAYPCPHCGGWHLTSKKRGRARKPKEAQ